MPGREGCKMRCPVGYVLSFVMTNRVYILFIAVNKVYARLEAEGQNIRTGKKRMM